MLLLTKGSCSPCRERKESGNWGRLQRWVLETVSIDNLRIFTRFQGKNRKIRQKMEKWMRIPSSKKFCFWCVSVFPACVYVPHACHAWGGQQRASDSQNLEWQMFVGWTIDAGNWTQVVWKRSQCSLSLNHLSSPCSVPFKINVYVYLYIKVNNRNEWCKNWRKYCL